MFYLYLEKFPAGRKLGHLTPEQLALFSVSLHPCLSNYSYFEAWQVIKIIIIIIILSRLL